MFLKPWGTALLAGFLLASCSGNQASSLPSTTTGASPSHSHVRKAATPNYVYVTDSTLNELFVYPAGVNNPTPSSTISLPGSPSGVITNSLGKVYVSVPSSYEILEYPSGGGSGTPIRTIAMGSGFEPMGLTVDSSDHLWVASTFYHGGGTANSNISEYTSTGTLLLQFEVVIGHPGYDIAIDPAGDLFANGYYQIEECSQTTETCSLALHTPDLSQPFAYTPSGSFAIGNMGHTPPGGKVSYYNPTTSPWTLISSFPFGTGTITLLTIGADGSQYIPMFYDSTSTSTVSVLPPIAGVIPVTISSGLVHAAGAAGGV